MVVTRVEVPELDPLVVLEGDSASEYFDMGRSHQQDSSSTARWVELVGELALAGVQKQLGARRCSLAD